MSLKKIGFIGCGMIASAMIEAFVNRAGDVPYPLIVSNRTEDKAGALADKYPARISLAKSFQECVDKSDYVVIAVLPGAAPKVIKSLKFRPEQVIVSLVFTMGKEEIEPLLNTSVEAVIHMLPGTFVSHVKGPFLMRPFHKETSEIFGAVGTMVALEDREQEKAMIALTAMFAPFFSVEDELISWAGENGVSSDLAAAYVSSLFKALAFEAGEVDAAGIHRLATENTPGGINMQAVAEIGKDGGFAAFSKALDGIYERVKNS